MGNTKAASNIVIPILEINVPKEEILALHASDQDLLKQIGTLLKELLNGKRTVRKMKIGDFYPAYVLNEV